jgi:low temperature requirement protein LtrA
VADNVYSHGHRIGGVKLTNRHGTPVDPVPFLVVAALAFLVSFSCGPIYLLALGLSLPTALAVSGVFFVLATGAAYRRMVLTARPELRGEIPAERRFRRLVYAAVVGVALLALLSLPFFVR